ncbi:MAG TPA: dienelactone hydrolase family protein [Jiangellales bacterium]|nr:dienelactone hydrolase family protein [Jiangellales bacterium]
MPTIEIPYADGAVTVYAASPSRSGPWPGVVVVHDAIGMGPEVRRQADWFAMQGFLAAAPDLFDGAGMLRCLPRIIRDYTRRQGPTFGRLDAARRWLADQAACSGRVGVAGFCLGGDFALLLAPTGRYDACSVNYGRVPRDAGELLRASCPVVGSYGARDRSLRGAADRLESVLEVAGVPHDVKEYEGAGHGFLNDFRPGEIPRVTMVLGRVMNAGYHEASAADARARILAFFRTYLA